jgi:hypothetical protein
MDDTYQKTTPSQDDGKKSEDQSGQTFPQTLSTTDNTNSKGNSGNTLTKKRKDVTVKVTGIESKIFRGDLNGI